MSFMSYRKNRFIQNEEIKYNLILWLNSVLDHQTSFITISIIIYCFGRI